MSRQTSFSSFVGSGSQSFSSPGHMGATSAAPLELGGPAADIGGNLGIYYFCE